MSDEQWLWLFVHQRIDADEKLERMCPKCREEVTSGNKKCIRCGKSIIEQESFVNPNFDMDKYNRLAGITTDEDEEDNSYECEEEYDDTVCDDCSVELIEENCGNEEV